MRPVIEKGRGGLNLQLTALSHAPDATYVFYRMNTGKDIGGLGNTTLFPSIPGFLSANQHGSYSHLPSAHCITLLQWPSFNTTGGQKHSTAQHLLQRFWWGKLLCLCSAACKQSILNMAVRSGFSHEYGEVKMSVCLPQNAVEFAWEVP